VPQTFLIPFILFFTLMDAYIGQNNPTELLFLVGPGVLAIIIRFASFPLAQLLIVLPSLKSGFGRSKFFAKSTND
jgi:putative tricarboxylic transport membrane protein